jgi:uncharacterized protein (DUF362 family)
MDLRPDRKKVVIKPNVVAPHEPNVGITTNPDFVGGIIDHLVDVGVTPESIAIAEGGGEEHDHDMVGRYFVISGIAAMAEERGVRMVDLNDDEPVRVELTDGQVFPRVPIASTIFDPDAFVINVPKMKTHNLGITTLSIKNWQGTVTPIQERHYCTMFPRYEGDPGDASLDQETVDSHARWAQKICDTHKARKPDLNVVEGIVGREGTGFMRGKNIPMGLAIAGINPVAVDTVTSYLMGFNPGHIGYLSNAAEQGLGTNDLSKIEVYRVEGEDLVPLSNLEGLRADPPFEIILAEQYKYTTLEGLIYSRVEKELSFDEFLEVSRKRREELDKKGGEGV